MAVAYPIKEGKNVLSIYDKDFHDSLNYEILIKDKSSCFSSVVVDIEGVFLCDGYAKLMFNLPCLPKWQYEITILNKDTKEEIHKINSIYQ